MKDKGRVNLSELILCPHCNRLHRRITLHENGRAICRDCGTVLYRYNKKVLERSLALSITGIILFIVSNLYPLVNIDMLGIEGHVSIISMLESLIDDGFYIVGIVVSFLVLIFPFITITIFMILILLLIFGIGEDISRDLLVLLPKIMPWSMLEIYLVSILVALVKLMGLVEIHFGLSFWALMLFVILDTYLNKSIHMGEFWELRERVFHEDR